jgi:hypothetical protein
MRQNANARFVVGPKCDCVRMNSSQKVPKRVVLIALVNNIAAISAFINPKV